jgi:hypothetical protein
LKPVSEDNAFTGTCSLCATKNTTLALFLQEPPTTRVTPGFPARGSKSKVAYPLAVGNFPETDIISSFIYCDACSVIATENGMTPSGDKVICALPLVSYSFNKEPYESNLQLAFHDRFDSEDLPLIFLASLFMRAQRIRSSRIWRDQLLLRAIEWACLDLSQSIQVPSSLVVPPCTQGNTNLAPLDKILTQSADDTLRSVSYTYLQYPMEGFIVMTMVLDILKKSKPKLRLAVETTVFERLLFHVVEQFHKHLADHGPILTHILMSQLLVQDSAKRDRLHGSRERQNASFRTLAGLTRAIFGDRKALTPKLSIGLDLLTTTPLLTADTMALLKKLGPIFDSIEIKSGHAIAVVLHYLYRFKVDEKSPTEHFARLVTHPKLENIFRDPSDISARTAEKLIDLLPPLEEPIDERTRMGRGPSPSPAG